MQSNQFFSLEQVIDRKPLILAPNTRLTDAIRQMQEWANSCSLSESEDALNKGFVSRINNSCALVVKNGQLLGIFTERDLVRLIATETDLAKISIAEVMTQELVTLTATGSEDIFTALNLLSQHSIRYLPIVDDRDRLLGLVTIDAVWELLRQKVELLQHQVQLANEAQQTKNTCLQTEIALSRQEELLQSILDNSPAIIYAKDIEGKYLLINHHYENLFHINREEVKGKTDYDIFPPEIADAFCANDRHILQTLMPQEWEEVAPHDDGLHTYLSVKFPLINAAGQPYGICGISTDINDRKLAELAVQESQERYRFAILGSRDGIWDWNIFTDEVIYSPRFKEMIGYTDAEMPNTLEAWSSKLHSEDRERVLTAVQNHLENRIPYDIEYRLQTKQGEYCWFHARGQAIWDQNNCPTRMAGSISDISERKQVEAKLQQSNQLLQAISSIQTQFLAAAESTMLFDGMLDRLLELTESEYGFIGEILFADDGSPIMEESYMKFRGRPYLKTRAFYAKNAPKGMEFHNLQTLFGAVIVTGKPVIANSPSTDSRRGGLPEGHSPLNAFLGLPFYKENHMTGMVGIANREGGYDEALIEYLQPFLATCSRIIEAHHSERQQQQAEQKIIEQAALLDVATDAIMVRGLNNQILFWNLGAKGLYGWTKAEALNKNANELLYQESLIELAEIKQAVREQGEWQGELTQITKAGNQVVVQSRWTLVRDRAGNPQSYLVVNTDITEKKHLENQFLRTQRLESLGTLAGGIAHDLNNILAPILGFSRLLPLKLPDIDEQTKGFFKIMEANAQRGSALVKQILTFSRGLEGDRGIVQIRHLIAEIKQIIEETFPKSIELEIDAPKNLWTVNADVNQIHQVLMNLTVNARDAMPDGGKLTIKAENFTVDADYARLHLDASEGAYVLVTVSDTGIGIAPEIIDRIFEPFFTTKEIGRGTGLGLSTAIGIIKSHGGFIDVVSDTKPATRGTQVKLFLPASEIAATTTAESEIVPEGNGELILVVDDESSILEVTQVTLETYNYRVLTARNGIEAIAIYAKNQDAIALVIMDIMMPSMDGKIAIRTLKQINPKLKIIAVSGLISSQEIIAEVDGEIAAFVAKPYSNDELLKTIYEQLVPIRG